MEPVSLLPDQPVNILPSLLFQLFDRHIMQSLSSLFSTSFLQGINSTHRIRSGATLRELGYLLHGFNDTLGDFDLITNDTKVKNLGYLATIFASYPDQFVTHIKREYPRYVLYR